MKKRLLTHKELNAIRYTIIDIYGLAVFYECPDGEPQKDYILVCADTESDASIRAWATGHIEVSEGQGIATEIVASIVSLLERMTVPIETYKTNTLV